MVLWCFGGYFSLLTYPCLLARGRRTCCWWELSLQSIAVGTAHTFSSKENFYGGAGPTHTIWSANLPSWVCPYHQLRPQTLDSETGEWRWEINIKIMELSIKQGFPVTLLETVSKRVIQLPKYGHWKALIIQLKLITLCFQLPGSLNNLGEYPPAFIMNSRANKLGRKGAVDKGDR